MLYTSNLSNDNHLINVAYFGSKIVKQKLSIKYFLATSLCVDIIDTFAGTLLASSHFNSSSSKYCDAILKKNVIGHRENPNPNFFSK